MHALQAHAGHGACVLGQAWWIGRGKGIVHGRPCTGCARGPRSLRTHHNAAAARQLPTPHAHLAQAHAHELALGQQGVQLHLVDHGLVPRVAQHLLNLPEWSGRARVVEV